MARLTLGVVVMATAASLLAGCTITDTVRDATSTPPPAPAGAFEAECDQVVPPGALAPLLGANAQPWTAGATEGATLAVAAAGGGYCGWSGESVRVELWALPSALVATPARGVECMTGAGEVRCLGEAQRESLRFVLRVSDRTGSSESSLSSTLESLLSRLPEQLPPVRAVPADERALAVESCSDADLAEAASLALGAPTQWTPKVDNDSPPTVILDTVRGAHVTCLVPQSEVSVTMVARGAFLVPSLAPGRVVSIDGATYARTTTSTGGEASTIVAVGTTLLVVTADSADAAERLAEALVALVAR